MNNPCPVCGRMVETINVAGVSVYGCANCCPSPSDGFVISSEFSLRSPLEGKQRATDPKLARAIEDATAKRIADWIEVSAIDWGSKWPDEMTALAMAIRSGDWRK